MKFGMDVMPRVAGPNKYFFGISALGDTNVMLV
jgi:hypothetical protein